MCIYKGHSRFFYAKGWQGVYIYCQCYNTLPDIYARYTIILYYTIL